MTNQPHIASAMRDASPSWQSAEPASLEPGVCTVALTEDEAHSVVMSLLRSAKWEVDEAVMSHSSTNSNGCTSDAHFMLGIAMKIQGASFCRKPEHETEGNA